jgi:DNA-binding XRE family transcriptional regulator
VNYLIGIAVWGGILFTVGMIAVHFERKRAHRYTLWMSDEIIDLLERWKVESNFSYSEGLRRAISLMSACYDAKKNGLQLAAIDQNDKVQYRFLSDGTRTLSYEKWGKIELEIALDMLKEKLTAVKLRFIRKSLDMSQVGLAKILDIEDTKIITWETDGRINGEDLEKLHDLVKMLQ